MSYLKQLEDEELEAHRREVLREQELRRKLDEGQEKIGQVLRDYLEAADLDCPHADDLVLGQCVVNLVVSSDHHPDPEPDPGEEEHNE